MYLGLHKDEEALLAEEQVNRRYDSFQELKNFHYRAMHNTIFVVATGTFVLSVSFIRNIHSQLLWPWLLIASWFFLGIAITCKIFSHILGSNIAEGAQNLLRDYRDSHYANTNFDVFSPSNSKIDNMHNQRLWADKVTLLFLVLGILALVIFASANLLY